MENKSPAFWSGTLNSSYEIRFQIKDAMLRCHKSKDETEEEFVAQRRVYEGKAFVRVVTTDRTNPARPLEFAVESGIFPQADHPLNALHDALNFMAKSIVNNEANRILASPAETVESKARVAAFKESFEQQAQEYLRLIFASNAPETGARDSGAS